MRHSQVALVNHNTGGTKSLGHWELLTIAGGMGDCECRETKNRKPRSHIPVMRHSTSPHLKCRGVRDPNRLDTRGNTLKETTDACPAAIPHRIRDSLARFNVEGSERGCSPCLTTSVACKRENERLCELRCHNSSRLGLRKGLLWVSRANI